MKDTIVIIGFTIVLIGMIAADVIYDQIDRQNQAELLLTFHPTLQKEYDMFMMDEWLTAYELETLKYLAITKGG